jgi:5-formyltetrahydrofolate cyclo-ligase
VSDIPDLRSLAVEDEVQRVAAPGRDKREIRSVVLAARRSLSFRVRAEQDHAIRTVLASVLAAIRPGLVCAYAPLSGEPGGSELLSALAGTPVLLPVLRDDLDLDWAAYPAPLVPGRYGLAEPTGERLGVAAIADADLIVAPGVAVAADGVRLGRGGGSYDRALARVAPSALVVVPLYEGELFAVLPAEPHDRPVHAAITPSGVRLLTHTRSALDERPSDDAPLALE